MVASSTQSRVLPPSWPNMAEATAGMAANSNGFRTLRWPPQGPVAVYCGNVVITSKYTVWSFAPLNLFEQFQKQANLYFLVISLIMKIGELNILFIGTIKAWSTAGMLGMMMSVSAAMAARDDINRHAADKEMNGRPCRVVEPDGSVVEKRWDQVEVGNVLQLSRSDEIPADVVALSCSNEDGNLMVSTANLDGETNLKPKKACLSGKELRFDGNMRVTELANVEVSAEAPNKNIYNFTGSMQVNNGESKGLGPDHILLRGCKVAGCNWVLGQVVYTGGDTRIQMNSRSVPMKLPNIEVIINRSMWVSIATQAVLALLTDLYFMTVKDYYRDLWYLYPNGFEQSLLLPDSVAYFITFFVLYSNLVPVSLYATMEVCNAAYAYFINNDISMVKPGQEPALARTTNLCHELGQVSYIFSDKTGTLTQNIMELRNIYIASKNYASKTGDAPSTPMDRATVSGSTESKFLRTLAVAHTVNREHGQGGTSLYEAESPDEEAFVQGATLWDWDFWRRLPGNEVEVKVAGKLEKYKVIATNAFDSARRAMSMVVEDPTGAKLLLVKGADAQLLTSARARAGTDFRDLQRQVDEYAKTGLRTLVIGCREFNSVDEQKELEAWLDEYRKAETAMENRKDKMQAVAGKIERDIEILGLTAIEDKLQDNVGDSIKLIRDAGIKFWVLTGDNLITARSIGFSTEVLTSRVEDTRTIPMNILTLDEDTNLEAVAKEFDELWKNAKRETKVTQQGKPYTAVLEDFALMITGGAFERISPDAKKQQEQGGFLYIASKCQVVIACRISPLQKSEFVALVRDNLPASGANARPVTLAIGDGANDVPMIQTAQVGVGIYGREGRQSANASDFAISEFQYLTRLLLLHGRWNYKRASAFTLFTFWRNALQVLLMCYYTYLSGFSGTPLFEDKLRITFNGLCSIPILGTGIFHRDVTEIVTLRNPQLYEAGRMGKDLNRRTMLYAMLHALSHSVIIGAIAVLAVPGLMMNGVDDYWSFNVITYTMLLVGANYRAGFLSRTLNLPVVLLQILSLGMYLMFLVVYNTFGVKLSPGLMYMVPAKVFCAPMVWLCVFVSLLCQLNFDSMISYIWHGFLPDVEDVLQPRDDPQHTNWVSGTGWFSKDAFQRQSLTSLQLLHRPVKAIVALIVSGIVLLLITTKLDNYNRNTFAIGAQYEEHELGALQKPYDTYDIQEQVKCSGKDTCRVTLKAQEDLKAPLLLYYQLDPFYQNFMHSLKKPLSSRDNMFNDTFTIKTDGVEVDRTKIAWKSDEKVLAKYGEDFNEDFAVWMRPSALSSTRKRYGWINEDIARGKKIEIDIGLNYDPNDKLKVNRAIVLSPLAPIFGKEFEKMTRLAAYLWFVTAFVLTLLSLDIFFNIPQISQAKRHVATILAGSTGVTETPSGIEMNELNTRLTDGEPAYSALDP
eukprot:TRINITY_DN25993_c0_g1_i1.p1 TRINITY_DN25993_c0_g1~~TRINITY_DN25993_c0_g1_i1.p1  ORF type:complete len:1421 (-),score=361.72 TRINITY_DN25993_c0_g1_i1:200-4462(-)